MNTAPRAANPPLSSSPADDELVELTRRGDRDAYRQLVERHQGRLLRVALDIVKNREDAEDVVQETFVKAFLSLHNFKGDSSFYGWIYRICTNMAIDIRRKASRRGGTHVEYKESYSVKERSGSDASDGGPLTIPGQHLQTVEGPHDALVRKETGKKLQDVLTELSEEHREIIVLREIDGLDYEEIASVLGLPKGTVMSRLFYARKAMQKALKDLAPANGGASDKKGEGTDGAA
jgi:RNA polymerase sigma-70 factor (ECF subfamily)